MWTQRMEREAHEIAQGQRAIVQHTPGPWTYTSTGEIIGAELRIAQCFFAPIMGNARLIAAAPDLLAVCERINSLRFSENGIGDALGGLGDQLEDAIAKAVRV